MKHLLKSGSFAILTALLLSGTALAGSRGGGGSDFTTKPKKGRPPQHHETTIASATATSLTIKEDKTQRTFAISPFTEITVNGQKAGAADLKPGMFVSVTMTDATRLSRIAATTKP